MHICAYIPSQGSGGQLGGGECAGGFLQRKKRPTACPPLTVVQVPKGNGVADGHWSSGAEKVPKPQEVPSVRDAGNSRGLRCAVTE